MDIETKCKIKQKLFGLAMIAMAILTLVLTKDATIAVFLIPMGLFVIFTKDCFMYDEYIEELEETEEEFY